MIISPNDRIHGFIREVEANPHYMSLSLAEFAGSWTRMSSIAQTILEFRKGAELCQSGIMQCVQEVTPDQSSITLTNHLTRHGIRALKALDDGFVWLSDPGRICHTSTINTWQSILNAPAISDENFQRAMGLRSPRLKEIRNAFVQRKLRSVRGINNMWVIAND